MSRSQPPSRRIRVNPYFLDGDAGLVGQAPDVDRCAHARVAASRNTRQTKCLSTVADDLVGNEFTMLGGGLTRDDSLH